MRQDRLQRVVRPPRPARSLPHTAGPATPVLSYDPIAAWKLAISINIWPLLASHAVLPASYCSPSHTRLELRSHCCMKNGYEYQYLGTTCQSCSIACFILQSQPATPVLSSDPIAAWKWLLVSIFGHYLPVMQYCLLHTAVPATPVLSSGPIAARKMAN